MDPNSMPDPFLSQYYGTSVPEPTEGDSLEKMAQLHLLEKLAEDEEIDLTQYSDEEILAMTDQVFGEGGEEPEAQGDDGDYEKIAAARFEEADYLGRVMAHSMWNELDAIQKAAAKAGPGVSYPAGAPAAEFDKEFARGAKKKRVAAARAADAAKYEGSAMAGRGHSGARSVGKAEGGVRSALSKMKTRKGRGKAALIGAGLAGGAALAAGGVLGAKALKKRKEEQQKTASALDTLSDSRAFDILANYGYVTEQGEIIPADGEPGQAWDVPFQKTASAELDEAIEEMAWGKLYDLGYLGE